ncbi:ABC transporter substrate-binding protein [Actinomyces urogenitalis]|uniref:ABC transporter substrate-binding protein n=1 Tax=Actinomyces urogenitalis TaxID=103621 RepID=UPI00145DD1F8|nr:ABC transporter substrate-binding protein [Actinomyces urogenitalis]
MIAMNRRHALSMLGCIGAGLVLTQTAGCASNDKESNVVALWAETEGARDRAYWETEVKAPFEKSYSDYQLQLTHQTGGDLEKKLRTALQAGQGPDIVVTPGPSYALQYVKAGMLENLTEWAEEISLKDRLVPWAYESGFYDGGLYSVPAEMETMLLFYNSDVFEKYGWGVPKNRNDLEAVASEAMSAGITPFAGGNQDWRAAVEWLMTSFWNSYAGPEALSKALRGEKPWTDAEFVEPVALLRDYFDKGWFQGSAKNYFATNGDDFRAEFGAGKAAMNIEGSWFLYSAEKFFDNPDGWDWTAMPPLSEAVQGDVYPLAVGSTFSVNAKSKIKNGAQSFIDWYFAEPGNGTKWNQALPAAIKPQVTAESELPSEMDERVRRLILDLVGEGSQATFGFATWTFWPPRTNTVIWEQLQRVLDGTVDPEDYMSVVAETFTQELDEGTVPKAFDPSK